MSVHCVLAPPLVPAPRCGCCIVVVAVLTLENINATVYWCYGLLPINGLLTPHIFELHSNAENDKSALVLDSLPILCVLQYPPLAEPELVLPFDMVKSSYGGPVPTIACQGSIKYLK